MFHFLSKKRLAKLGRHARSSKRHGRIHPFTLSPLTQAVQSSSSCNSAGSASDGTSLNWLLSRYPADSLVAFCHGAPHTNCYPQKLILGTHSGVLHSRRVIIRDADSQRLLRASFYLLPPRSFCQINGHMDWMLFSSKTFLLC